MATDRKTPIAPNDQASADGGSTLPQNLDHSSLYDNYPTGGTIDNYSLDSSDSFTSDEEADLLGGGRGRGPSRIDGEERSSEYAQHRFEKLQASLAKKNRFSKKTSSLVSTTPSARNPSALQSDPTKDSGSDSPTDIYSAPILLPQPKEPNITIIDPEGKTPPNYKPLAECAVKAELTPLHFLSRLFSGDLRGSSANNEKVSKISVPAKIVSELRIFLPSIRGKEIELSPNQYAGASRDNFILYSAQYPHLAFLDMIYPKTEESLLKTIFSLTFWFNSLSFITSLCLVSLQAGFQIIGASLSQLLHHLVHTNKDDATRTNFAALQIDSADSIPTKILKGLGLGGLYFLGVSLHLLAQPFYLIGETLSQIHYIANSLITLSLASIHFVTYGLASLFTQSEKIQKTVNAAIISITSALKTLVKNCLALLPTAAILALTIFPATSPIGLLFSSISTGLQAGAALGLLGIGSGILLKTQAYIQNAWNYFFQKTHDDKEKIKKPDHTDTHSHHVIQKNQKTKCPSHTNINSHKNIGKKLTDSRSPSDDSDDDGLKHAGPHHELPGHQDDTPLPSKTPSPTNLPDASIASTASNSSNNSDTDNFPPKTDFYATYLASTAYKALQAKRSERTLHIVVDPSQNTSASTDDKHNTPTNK